MKTKIFSLLDGKIRLSFPRISLGILMKLAETPLGMVFVSILGKRENIPLEKVPLGNGKTGRIRSNREDYLSDCTSVQSDQSLL